MTPWGASSSASESEDDTPETLSFNSSKKAAKGVEHARQEYEANERRKQKEANRERDRRLKERAEAKEKEKEAAASGKRKTRDRKVKQPASEKSDDESEGGDAAGPRNELEARMARAMQEAEQESDEGDGGEDDEEATGSASDGSADEEDASEDDSDAQNSESESGSSQSGSEEEEEEEPEAPAHPKRMPSAPAYLPDELFKAAFSKAASSSKRRLDAEDEPDEASPRPRKQRKPAKRVGKDITVGCVSCISWEIVQKG